MIALLVLLQATSYKPKATSQKPKPKATSYSHEQHELTSKIKSIKNLLAINFSYSYKETPSFFFFFIIFIIVFSSS